MNEATLRQGNRIQDMILRHEVPSERLQQVLESGALDDLLHCNPRYIDRLRLREAIGFVDPDQIFEVTVDYDEPFEKKIEESGLFCNRELRQQLRGHTYPLATHQEGQVPMRIAIPQGRKMIEGYGYEEVFEDFVERRLILIDPYALLDWFRKYGARLQPYVRQIGRIVAGGCISSFDSPAYTTTVFTIRGGDRSNHWDAPVRGRTDGPRDRFEACLTQVNWLNESNLYRFGVTGRGLTPASAQYLGKPLED